MIFYPPVFPTLEKFKANTTTDVEEIEYLKIQHDRISRGLDGEKLVYDTLCKIQEEWIVFHSFRLISTPKNSYRYYDKEIDFLILIPDEGLICLEVKNHRWVHDYEEEDSLPPITQADKARWEVVNWLKDVKMFDTHRFEHTTGALMLGAQPSHDDDKKYLWGREKCCDPQELKRFILRQFTRGIGASEETINELHKILRRPQIYNVSLSDYDYIMQEATANMGRILPMLAESSKGVNVTGCAGSGKTVMALQEACRLAEEGKSVLYLCYNKNLGIWLRHSETLKTLTKKDNLTIKHIHKFISDILPGNEVFHQEDLTEDQILDIAFFFSEHQEKTFDYIFVDEAQDFLRNYWKVVRYALKVKPSGHLYTFSDDEQILRKTDSCVTPLPTKIRLTTNLRNSKEIALYGSSILKSDSIRALELKTQNVNILPAEADAAKRASSIQSLVRDLLDSEKSPIPVTKDQIVILSPWRMDNKADCCSFNYLPDRDYWKPNPDVTDIALIEKKYENTLFNPHAQRILAETIRSFKGLEAGFVILTDIPAPSKLEHGFSLSDFYVACSRAKFGLYIIPMNQAGEEASRTYLPQES